MGKSQTKIHKTTKIPKMTKKSNFIPFFFKDPNNIFIWKEYFGKKER